MRDIWDRLAEVRVLATDLLGFVWGLDAALLTVIPETDRRTYHAVKNALIELSEAVEQLPSDVFGRHQAINWRGFIRLRDTVRHRNFRAELPWLWSTVTGEIPALLDAVGVEFEQLAQPTRRTKPAVTEAAETKLAKGEPPESASLSKQFNIEFAEFKPIHGSYYRAAREKIRILAGQYADSAEDISNDVKYRIFAELAYLTAHTCNLLDDWITELDRVERVRNAGPIQQQRNSQVLQRHIAAAAFARWYAEPNLSKKALAVKLEKERPDLGSWRTILEHLPRKADRETWERSARGALLLLLRLTHKNTWDDPACQNAIPALQQM